MPKLDSEESNTKNRMNETLGADTPLLYLGIPENAYEAPSMMRRVLDDRSVEVASRMAEAP